MSSSASTTSKESSPKPKIPATQLAWVNEARGAPRDALFFKNDWPVDKKLAPGEVIVKIEAAALNPVGYKMMKMLPNVLSKRPLVIEHDFSGTIADAGDSMYSVGEPVFGIIPFPLQRTTRQGTLCQYTRLPATHVAHRPPNIKATQAAGIALAAETAYQALFTLARVKEGQTIFVNGGSTAVGAFAIQLAKAKGLKVVASASAKNEKFVRAMGADEFVDYTKGPLHETLAKLKPSPKFDVILEAVGLVDPSLYTKSVAYFAPKGIFLTVGPQPSMGDVWAMIKAFFAINWPFWLGGRKQRYKSFFLSHKKEYVDALSSMLAEGTLRPIVDSIYDFGEAYAAYDRLMTGRAVGKIVIKVDPRAE